MSSLIPDGRKALGKREEIRCLGRDKEEQKTALKGPPGATQLWTSMAQEGGACMRVWCPKQWGDPLLLQTSSALLELTEGQVGECGLTWPFSAEGSAGFAQLHFSPRVGVPSPGPPAEGLKLQLHPNSKSDGCVEGCGFHCHLACRRFQVRWVLQGLPTPNVWD